MKGEWLGKRGPIVKLIKHRTDDKESSQILYEPSERMRKRERAMIEVYIELMFFYLNGFIHNVAVVKHSIYIKLVHSTTYR